MTTVAVAGAAGFVGSHVVERLVADGHRVVALDRPGEALDAHARHADVVGMDLLDEDRTVSALDGCHAAVNATGLFDLGASEEALERVNVTLAARFARAARSAGVTRVVHVSSVAVYGAPSRLPQDETGPLRPRIAYERTKLAGERAALALNGDGLEVTVMRPTLVYGPRSRYGQALVIATMAQLRALGVRRARLLVGGPLGHHVHVEDVAGAAALLAFADGVAGRAFNVADDAPIPHGDAISAIATALGLEVDVGVRAPFAWSAARLAMTRWPDALLGRLNGQLARGRRALGRRGVRTELEPRFDADWVSYGLGEFVFDTTRLRALGFRPRHPTFVDALPGVVAWYERAGFIPGPPGEPGAVAGPSERAAHP